MANIFDSANNASAFAKLQTIKKELEEEQAKKEKEQIKKYIDRHKSSHIFKSAEDALDWCIAHPGKYIVWYLDDIKYDETKGLFIDYGQDSDYDGINFWSTKKELTKEQLIARNEEHVNRVNTKYPDMLEKKWWLDEYGYLSNIYLPYNEF